MEVTCLMENTVGNELCQSEHGLSLYVETENHTVLIDTGASGLFIENARNLGIDLSKVEMVFLSHGHYDHGGGILAFHKINPMVPIIMQKSALGDYWHKSTLVKKYIGLNSGIREIENLVLLEGDLVYDREILKCEADCGKNKQYGAVNGKGENVREYPTDNKNREYVWKLQEKSKVTEAIDVFTLKYKNQDKLKCWPQGNLVLKEKVGNEYIQDHFVHEQYIVLHENGKSVLISGCAHNGILNILEEYRNIYGNNPDVIISGFHMRKKTGYSKQDFEVIRETAEVLKETGILCYTGHCTGEEPYRIMKEIMGEQLQYVHCGDVFEIL